MSNSKSKINSEKEITCLQSFTALRSKSLLYCCHFCSTTDPIEVAKNEGFTNTFLQLKLAFSVGLMPAGKYLTHTGRYIAATERHNAT